MIFEHYKKERENIIFLEKIENPGNETNTLEKIVGYEKISIFSKKIMFSLSFTFLSMYLL